MVDQHSFNAQPKQTAEWRLDDPRMCDVASVATAICAGAGFGDDSQGVAGADGCCDTNGIDFCRFMFVGLGHQMKHNAATPFGWALNDRAPIDCPTIV